MFGGMAFKWFSVPLTTSVGTVYGLHWDYCDATPSTPSPASQAETGGATEASFRRGAGIPLADDASLDEAEDELGAVMWNANTVAFDAIVEVLHGKGPRPLDGHSILELGSGVGVLGAAMSLAGARVMITDLPKLVPLMRKTISLNVKASKMLISASGFDWMLPKLPAEVAEFVTSSGGRLVVVLCDALYGNPKSWPPLIAHMENLADLAPGARFLNFCEQRVEGHEDSFFNLMREKTSKWTFETSTLEHRSELGLAVRMTSFSRGLRVREAQPEEGVKKAHRAEH